MLELLIVTGVIGVVSMIAVPNFLEALRRAQVRAAYSSMLTLDQALQTYMAEFDVAPSSLNPQTLEPLVSAGVLTYAQSQAIVTTLAGERVLWYRRTDPFLTWDYAYTVAFRPKGKDDPSKTHYLTSQGLWWHDEATGWHQVN